ncbi:hypothetical protein B0T20DRAFT_402717 [Sordaria brevicollis]|uniref:Uncharacterized protein n=1 Tax=Sordaria brevicollis TaxID=83679 RepID=A0AAE0UFE3_SORBR|nr:hypothetical protein B0T20DRAFT_402717 [Sordaria brevicollis]
MKPRDAACRETDRESHPSFDSSLFFFCYSLLSCQRLPLISGDKSSEPFQRLYIPFPPPPLCLELDLFVLKHLSLFINRAAWYYYYKQNFTTTQPNYTFLHTQNGSQDSRRPPSLHGSSLLPVQDHARHQQLLLPLCPPPVLFLRLNSHSLLPSTTDRNTEPMALPIVH